MLYANEVTNYSRRKAHAEGALNSMPSKFDRHISGYVRLEQIIEFNRYHCYR